MRVYTKFKNVSIIDDLKIAIESGQYTHQKIVDEFKISRRQIVYLINKHDMQNNLLIDRSYMKTQEYRQAISNANLGKIRSDEQKSNYIISANRRAIKNNRGSGWFHSEETIAKITNSNLQIYKNLPQKWIDSCINNNDWFIKLSESAPSTKSKEHIIKSVEARVGMPYDVWQIVRGEYDKYCSKVRQITDSQPLSTLENYEKRGSQYHLDHKFSICEGFRQQISPIIIGNISNLIIISAHDNVVKNKKCSITLQELMEMYNECCKLS